MFLFSKNILGIDLHDHLVQFVELKKRGGQTTLETYNRITLPEGTIQDGEVKQEEALKESIKKLLQEANPSPVKVKDFALILPTQVTFVHIFHFPYSLSPADLRKLIPVEAENILPYSVDEVYWDFTILDRSKERGQSVLFAATPKTCADHYVKIFGELGLSPVLFGIQPEALQSALFNKLIPGKKTMVVELGALASNYLFLDGTILQRFVSINGGIEALIQTLSKSFSIPSDDLWANWEQHKNNSQFASLCKDFVQKEYKQTKSVLDETWVSGEAQLDSLIFTGEFSNLPNFYEEAQRYFPDKNVLIGDPKSNVVVDDKRFASNPEKYGVRVPYSIYFTDAIGVALRALHPVTQTLNLIPDALKTHFSQRKLAFIFGASSVLMTMLSGLMVAHLFYENRQMSFVRLNYEIQKSGIEKTLFGTRYMEIKEELTIFNEEVTALTKIDQTLISLPLVMEDVLSLIPEEVSVLSITYDDSALFFEVTGVSKSREALLALQDNLENAELVKDFDIPLSSYDQKSETSFSVSIFLNFSKLPSYGSSQAE